MHIDWKENPLATQVILTDREKEIYKLKVVLSEIRDTAYSAYFHLRTSEKEKKYYDPERAFKYLQRIVDSYGEDIGEDSHFEVYLGELSNGYHCGDCTCFAATCMKCLAEDKLGVDTLEGLRPHSIVKIDSAFRADKNRTIDDVIAVLKRYEPSRGGSSEQVFNDNRDRWIKEAEAAHDWLVRYKEEKFLKGPSECEMKIGLGADV